MTDRDGTTGANDPRETHEIPETGMNLDALDAALARALDPVEVAEIMRLDRALAELDHGRLPDIDPTEDPELHSLVTAARVVDHSFEATTTTRAFNSFHHRSKNALLHTLEAERPVPFRERLRIVVAAAAGLAAVVISATALGAPALDSLRGTDGPEASAQNTENAEATPGVSVSVANLTHVQTQEQLDRLSLAVDGLRTRALSGQSLSSAQLHEFTENAARVADSIERQPDTVSPEAVRSYMERAQAAQDALNSGQLEPGAEDAAVAAQRAAEDGLVVASRYLGGEGGPDGSPLPGTTPEPTEPTEDGTDVDGDGQPDDPDATATPTTTATPTSSVTPTATPTPTSSATSTATPTSSVTPTPTPTGVSTPNSSPTIE